MKGSGDINGLGPLFEPNSVAVIGVPAERVANALLKLVEYGEFLEAARAEGEEKK